MGCCHETSTEVRWLVDAVALSQFSNKICRMLDSHETSHLPLSREGFVSNSLHCWKRADEPQ
jgi:hypothetical protein